MSTMVLYVSYKNELIYITLHCDGSFNADGSNCGMLPPVGSPTNSTGG